MVDRGEGRGRSGLGGGGNVEFIRIRRWVGRLPFLGVVTPAKRSRQAVRRERIVFMVVILETLK